MHYIKILYRNCFVQNFMRINSYVLNIFYRMSFKENIWRKLILSTLFSKFRHIRARFLSARKLSVIKDHLKKRIKLFPVCPHFFLFWNIFYSHFDWPIRTRPSVVSRESYVPWATFIWDCFVVWKLQCCQLKTLGY